MAAVWSNDLSNVNLLIFTTRSRNFSFFNNFLRNFYETLVLLVLSDFLYDSKIFKKNVNFQPQGVGNSAFSKYNFLRYLFETLLLVVSDLLYN